MLTMGFQMAHATCVIQKLNELLDPDYEDEPDKVIGFIEKAYGKGYDDCLNLIMRADSNTITDKIKPKIEEAKKQERKRILRVLGQARLIASNYMQFDPIHVNEWQSIKGGEK